MSHRDYKGWGNLDTTVQETRLFETETSGGAGHYHPLPTLIQGHDVDDFEHESCLSSAGGSRRFLCPLERFDLCLQVGYFSCLRSQQRAGLLPKARLV